MASATLKSSSREIVSFSSSLRRSPFENSEITFPLFSKSLDRLSSFPSRKLEFLVSPSSSSN